MKPIVQLLLHVKKARSALGRGRKADAKRDDPARNTIFAASSTSVYVFIFPELPQRYLCLCR